MLITMSLFLNIQECPVYKCIGEEKCYNYTEKCDNKLDCADGTDESGCRKYLSVATILSDDLLSFQICLLILK